MTYDWTKNTNYVPRKDLYAWHQYDPLTSADGVAIDASGNSRDLITATNKSILTPSVLNGQSGWYFDGTKDPMLYDSTVQFQHVFLVVSADEPAFGDFRGLLSDKTATTLLVGENGTDRFFDVSGAEIFDFRKGELLFAPADQKAPLSGKAAVIELQIPGGVIMDAIQIGKQKNLSRLWKGYFFEGIYYTSILNDLGRQRIYEYFAMRYQIWSQTAAGLDIYPFAANKTRAVEADVENYVSTPYTGDPRALVRGSVIGNYDLPYLLREQAEYDAAKAFFKQHRPITPFAFRDYRFYPYREVDVRFASPIREQGSDVTYRFNYTFSVTELDFDAMPPVISSPTDALADLSDAVTDLGEFLTDAP